MKANLFKGGLLLLLASAVFDLSAQENEADRKLLADSRTKAGNDTQAEWEPSEAFLKGNLSLTTNFAEGLKQCREHAERNRAEAQYCLAHCYANGAGVEKDEVEAVKWYRRAAEQDYASAQYALGDCYAKGT